MPRDSTEPSRTVSNAVFGPKNAFWVNSISNAFWDNSCFDFIYQVPQLGIRYFQTCFRAQCDSLEPFIGCWSSRIVIHSLDLQTRVDTERSKWSRKSILAPSKDDSENSRPPIANRASLVFLDVHESHKFGRDSPETVWSFHIVVSNLTSKIVYWILLRVWQTFDYTKLKAWIQNRASLVFLDVHESHKSGRDSAEIAWASHIVVSKLTSEQDKNLTGFISESVGTRNQISRCWPPYGNSSELDSAPSHHSIYTQPPNFFWNVCHRAGR